MTVTAISAPGKVLLAGGYLVVDRAYTGLVFGLSARIHVLVASAPQSNGVEVNEILVRSPQFEAAEWRYGYRVVEDSGGVEVVQLKSDSRTELSRNKFVETALTFALSYISAKGSRIHPTNITILADDDYYSQSKTSSPCTQNPSSRFQNFNVTLSDAHKTGLGSSAALVTAFVSSVVAHHIPESNGGVGSENWQRRIHNLAQAAHCTAQGKIGSGFDVAAAVYGSCVYRRFSPSVLEEMGSVGSPAFSERLRKIVDDDGSAKIWDTQVFSSAVRMPDHLRLVMCDVDCGSETPSMVRKVFSWRKEKSSEALLLWETLQKGNEDLAAQLERLTLEPDVSLDNLSATILTNRSLIREMSEKADVPIEPLVQTQLLDACSSIAGVVGGVVPGAGGYDALVLIIEDRDEVKEELSSLLATYRPKVTGDGPIIGNIRLLAARQEMDGLLSESESTYLGWL